MSEHNLERINIDDPDPTLEEIKADILVACQHADAKQGIFTTEMLKGLTTLAEKYPQEYFALYNSIYQYRFPNDDLAKTFFNILQTKDDNPTITNAQTNLLRMYNERSRNTLQDVDKYKKIGVDLAYPCMKNMHIALVLAEGIKTKTPIGIADDDSFETINEKIKTAREIKFDVVRSSYIKPSQITQALQFGTLTYTGSLPLLPAATTAPPELADLGRVPTQSERKQEEFRKTFPPPPPLPSLTAQYQQTLEGAESKITKDGIAALEKQEASNIAQEENFAKEREDKYTKKTANDLTNKEKPQKEKPVSPTLKKLPTGSWVKTSMDDERETKEKDPTVVAYYRIDNPGYAISPIYALLHNESQGNDRKINTLQSLANSPSVARLQIQTSDNMILPSLLNGDGVLAVPDPQSFKDEDGNSITLPITLEQHTGTGSYRVKTSFKGVLSYELKAIQTPTTSLYSSSPDTRQQRSDPHTKAIIEQGKTFISRGKYAEALALAQTHLKSRFKYTTLSACYEKNLDTRDTQMQYGDCDVLAEQLQAYLDSMGMQSSIQTCIMDTNHDGSFMKGELHAILAVQYPDGTHRYVDATTDVTKAPFQDPKATELPTNMHNGLAVKHIEVYGDNETKEIQEVIVEFNKGLEACTNELSIINYCETRLNAIEALETINPLQAIYYTHIYKHYYQFTLIKDFDLRVYRALKEGGFYVDISEFGKDPDVIQFPYAHLQDPKNYVRNNSSDGRYFGYYPSTEVTSSFAKTQANDNSYLGYQQRSGSAVFPNEGPDLSRIPEPIEPTKICRRDIAGHRVEYNNPNSIPIRNTDQWLCIDDKTFDLEHYAKKRNRENLCTPASIENRYHQEDTFFAENFPDRYWKSLNEECIIIAGRNSKNNSYELKRYNDTLQEFELLTFETTLANFFMEHSVIASEDNQQQQTSDIKVYSKVDYKIKDYHIDYKGKTLTQKKEEAIKDLQSFGSVEDMIPQVFYEKLRLQKKTRDGNGNYTTRLALIENNTIVDTITLNSNENCLIRDIKVVDGEYFVQYSVSHMTKDMKVENIDRIDYIPKNGQNLSLTDDVNNPTLGRVEFGETGLIVPKPEDDYYDYGIISYKNVIESADIKNRPKDGGYQEFGIERFPNYYHPEEADLQIMGDVPKDIKQIPGTKWTKSNNYLHAYCMRKPLGHLYRDPYSGQEFFFPKDSLFKGSNTFADANATVFDIPLNKSDSIYQYIRPDAQTETHHRNTVATLERFCRKSPLEEIRQRYFQESLPLEKQMREIELFYAQQARKLQETQLIDRLYEILDEEIRLGKSNDSRTNELPEIRTKHGISTESLDGRKDSGSVRGEAIIVIPDSSSPSVSLTPGSTERKKAQLKKTFPGFLSDGNLDTVWVEKAIQPGFLGTILGISEISKIKIAEQALLYHQADIVKNHEALLYDQKITQQQLTPEQQKAIPGLIDAYLHPKPGTTQENTFLNTEANVLFEALPKVGTPEYETYKKNLTAFFYKDFQLRNAQNSYRQSQKALIQEKIGKDPVYQELTKRANDLNNQYNTRYVLDDALKQKHQTMYEQFESLPQEHKINLFHRLMLYNPEFLKKWMYPEAEQAIQESTPALSAEEIAQEEKDIAKVEAIDQLLRPKSIDKTGVSYYVYPFPHLDPKRNDAVNIPEKESLLQERHTLCVRAPQKTSPQRKKYDFDKPEELEAFLLEEKREQLRSLMADQKAAVMSQALSNYLIDQYKDNGILHSMQDLLDLAKQQEAGY